jgi:cell division protein FtsB
MQSDQKAIGVTFVTLVLLGGLILLFAGYTVLNVPSMLDGGDSTAKGSHTVGSTARQSYATTGTAHAAHAAQQAAHYRQRNIALTLQIETYQKQIDRLTKRAAAASTETPGLAEPTVSSVELEPAVPGEDDDLPQSDPVAQLLELNRELASMRTSLTNSQDTSEDLLAQKLALEAEIDTLEDTLTLLEEINQSADDTSVRRRQLSIQAAAATFARMEESAIPYLIECLAGEDVEIQIWGADVLGRIGPDASTAVPDLRRLQDSQNANLRLAIGRALESILDD